LRKSSSVNPFLDNERHKSSDFISFSLRDPEQDMI